MGALKLTYQSYQDFLENEQEKAPNLRIVPNHEPTSNPDKNYYAFGMLMPNRNSSSPNYRYGFNGKEKDDEVKGSGNSYNFGARIYDSRVGRFLSTDPWENKYVWQTPYAYFSNSPIATLDWNGYGGDPRVKVDKKTKTININLKFNFNRSEDQSLDDFNKAKQAHMQQVKNDLDGKIANWKNEDYTVKVNVSEGKGKNSITVNFDLDLDRSNAIKNGYEQNINPSHNSATHETLHNLGLSDRYSYTQSKSFDKSVGATVVPGTFGYIPISLKGQYDPQYYGHERDNIMWQGGGKGQITKRQWRHIIGRRAEKDHRQTTYFHGSGGNPQSAPLTYRRNQVGRWIYNNNNGSSTFQRISGYDIFYNSQTNKGSKNRNIVNTPRNKSSLELPYE